MKAKTKLEKQVVASNGRLTAISQKAVDWAVKHLIDHVAFRTSGRKCTCGDCGQRFTYDGKTTTVKCPHCGRGLKVNDTMKRTFKDATYFSTLDVIDGLQVQRVFRLNVHIAKGKPLSADYAEVCRLWLDERGHTALTSLKRSLGYYIDSFNWESEIELRTMSNVHSVISDTYVYPQYKLIPVLKRNGMSLRFIKCHPFLLMKSLVTDRRIETLVKSGNTKAVDHFLKVPTDLDLCWKSHIIAMRRGYVIKDYSLWCDTVRLLDRLGRDIRSAKYICPADLSAEHDKWLRKVHAEEKKRLNMEQLKRAKEKEELFYADKSRFFGIVISDEDIEISVLDSIEAYKAEGDAMKHCVFSMEYYTRPDSIVLSARDRDGKRIETIELSLTDFKVVQSRGVCNKNTEYHDRIISLINANVNKFIQAKELTVSA